MSLIIKKLPISFERKFPYEKVEVNFDFFSESYTMFNRI